MLNHDKYWKNFIRNYAEEFIAFFYPALYPLIDFSKEIDFLDKEFFKFMEDGSAEGTTFKDKLLKLHNNINFNSSLQQVWP